MAGYVADSSFEEDVSDFEHANDNGQSSDNDEDIADILGSIQPYQFEPIEENIVAGG